MPPAVTRQPVELPPTVAMFDAVAHFLWHCISDAQSGFELPGLPVPPSVAAVSIQLVRDVMGSVLDLLDSGQLILWSIDEDEERHFELAVPGVN